MPSALSIVKRFFPKVKRVQDAQAECSIRVSQTDCASPGIQDHTNCAMAVACKRQLGANGAIVSLHSAYVIHGNAALRYRVPESVSREVVSFDRKGGFSPGTYKLNAPAKGHRLGEHYKASNKWKHRRHRKIPIRHLTAGVRSNLRDAHIEAA